jgi:hypothetical protein
MARKSSIPFDDIAKAIAKAVAGSGKKTAPKAAKGAKKAAKGKPKGGPAPKPPKGRGTGGAAVKATPKPKKPSGSGAKKTKKQIEMTESTPLSAQRNIKTTRGPKGQPERPRMTREQYLESQANKMLRGGGRPQARVDDPRAGVAPNIPRVPKRSKAKPKGSSASHEADPLRREVAADARRMGERTPSVTPRKKSSGDGKRKQARKAQKAEFDELRAKRRAKLEAARKAGKYAGLRPQPKKS